MFELKGNVSRNNGDSFDISVNKKTNGNGIIVNEYIRDGVKCPFSDIDSDKGRQAGKFQLIVKDLECVEANLLFMKNNDLFKEVEQRDADLISNNCLAASIVLYAKCFTEAKHRGSSLHAKEHVYDPLSAFKDVHDFLVHVRNNFFAHAGDANIEDACSRVIFHDGGAHPIAHAQYAFSLSTDFLELFLSLVQCLKKNIQDRVIKLINKEFKKFKKIQPDNIKIKFEFKSKSLTWEDWNKNR